MIKIYPHLYEKGDTPSNKIQEINEHRECITVVIPTMLLCPKEFFGYTLEQFNSNDLVKEIIIIDNTDNKDFDKSFPITPKINVIKPQVNLGATYNPGMQLCKTEYYLLINDDVACRSSILDSCFNIMEQDIYIGLLQINTLERQPINLYISSDTKRETEYIIPLNPLSCMCGWFQFGRKENWIDIPNELKYFYGDNLMIDIMKHKKLKIARLISDHISHMLSCTVSKIVNDSMLHHENIIYHNVLKKVLS